MQIYRLLPIVFALASAGVFSAEPALATQVIKDGFSLPIFAGAPRGDTTRLFVVEQHSGAIKIIHLADNSVTTFLTVANVTQGGEQGLLGLAFHPQYATNGFFYVNYTTTIGGVAKSAVDRFHATSADSADPDSRTPIINFDDLEGNHNGGWIGFGPDGFLYISSGDGGGGNDQHGTIGNGQDRTNLLGKILRIDVDGGSPYAIPPSNPYAGSTQFAQEIWAFGLRNPWRCSFDRVTGDLWIGDVGQGSREEIDVIPNSAPARNFGWRAREGRLATPSINETPVTPTSDPIYDYTHANDNSVVIGGYVYRGSAIAGLQGTYFFSDFGGRHFWSFRPVDGANFTTFMDRTAEFGGSQLGVTAYGEDAAGELYMCDYSGGQILKIVAANPGGGGTSLAISSMSASANPAMTQAEIAFTAVATGPAGSTLTYAWEFGDGTTASGAAVTQTYAASGLYTVKLTVSDGTTSVSKIMNVVVNDQPSTGVLIVSRASLSFNFVKANSDSMVLAGQIGIAPNFVAAGKTVRLQIGAFDKTFALGANGVSTDKSFKLRTRPGNTLARFTLTLRKQSLFDQVSMLGITKTQDVPGLDLPFAFTLDGQSNLAHRIMNYRVRVSRNGPQSARAR